MPQDSDRIIRLGTQQEEAVFLQYARGMEAAIASGREFDHWVGFFLAIQDVSPVVCPSSMTHMQYIKAVERRNNSLRPQLRLRVELLRLGGYPFPLGLAPNGGQAGPAFPGAPGVPGVPGMFPSGQFIPRFLPHPPPIFLPAPALPPFAPDFAPIALAPGVQLPPGAGFPPNPPTTPAVLTFTDPTTPSAIGTSSQIQAHHVDEAPSAVGTSSQAGAYHVNETHDSNQNAEARPTNASPNACLIETNREFFVALRDAIALIVAGHSAFLCNCSVYRPRD